ncbi:hypothetical protein [uncultured Pontibacter sp.]|uniref:hypothetical protein n=1 Tax=uncultured Pontibacter sp. TaxID=453356 RepID=UPI0026139671|nr:hypothetical protein [uncultured Pontibacter sp.]
MKKRTPKRLQLTDLSYSAHRQSCIWLEKYHKDCMDDAQEIGARLGFLLEIAKVHLRKPITNKRILKKFAMLNHTTTEWTAFESFHLRRPIVKHKLTDEDLVHIKELFLL